MNDFVNTLRATLDGMDHGNDALWTAAGLPSVDAVRSLAGDPSITRADIEAAKPGFVRKEDADAAQEPQPLPAADAEATEREGRAGEETPVPDAEGDQEEDAPLDAGSGAMDEDIGAEAVAMSLAEIQVRGLLMSVILRLPSNMRVASNGVMLNGMAQYLVKFDQFEERVVVVELMKAIAETTPQDIPSGHYRDRIDRAMHIVRGGAEDLSVDATPAEESHAAAQRLQNKLGRGGAPAPHQTMPSALDERPGTEEQQGARARLISRK